MAKSTKSTKKSVSEREARVIKLSEELTDDAKRNAKHINYISFGSDKNKTRKNSKACDRGTSSGPARYCSSHLRSIYPQDIIGDNNKTEWCVEGRHNKDNSCRLCNIDSRNYMKFPMIKFAEALAAELGVRCNTNDPERNNRALQSFLTSHIISAYPGTNGENTILRIKRNGKVWMEYFIKLTAFSSLLKTSAPSGYKYKDRISVGNKIKIQNNQDRDLIFCIEKDAKYDNPEKERQRPVVNGVGFWNLLKKTKQGEIRSILQLNIDQAVNVCFGFLLKNDHNVQKIEVELECTRHGLNLNEKPITLWCWPSNNDDNNSMSSIDVDEHKSNTNGSPTISTQSLPSARSTSPMSSVNYPSYPLNTIPIISQNSIPMAISMLPPQLPQLSELTAPQTLKHSRHQPQIDYDYTNNHPQPQMIDTHPIRHYGAYHSTNYTRRRYSPYRRQQRSEPIPTQMPMPTQIIDPNRNNSQVNLIDFESQQLTPYEIMEQDQGIDDQHRYSQYHRQQSSAPLSMPRSTQIIDPNQNNSQINFMGFESQQLNQYPMMEQDQFNEIDQPLFIQRNDDVLNPDTFSSFPDNETLFAISALNNNHQQYSDDVSLL